MFEPIIQAIEKHDSIVIFGHLNPDGDCYGSQVALKAIIQNNFPKKEVYIVGKGIPRLYEVLGKMDDISDEIVAKSLAVILDSNDLSRVEDKRVSSACHFVKVDHHVNTFTFHEGEEVIDDKATSTCELIFRLANEAKWVINELAANGLFLGLMTDTARFQFTFDYVNMFDIAKRLCELGANPQQLAMKLNVVYPYQLKIKSFIYRNYRKDDGVIYVLARLKDRKALNATSQQIVSQTSLIGHVKSYPVWLIISETDTGGMQVEMRSEGVNVQTIAAYFGGGGHIYAAGFTIDKFSIEKVNELLTMCKKAIKEGI